MNSSIITQVSLLSILPILTNMSKQIRDESQPKGKFWPECVVNFAQLRRVLQPGNVETAAAAFQIQHHRPDWPDLVWSTFIGLSQTSRSLIFLPKIFHIFQDSFLPLPIYMMQTYAATDVRREFRMRPLLLQ